MIKQILSSLMLAFLIACGISDYKNRSVDIRILCCGGAIGLTWALIFKISLLGIIPGLTLVMLSLIINEAIGIGDGLFYVACGMVFGLKRIVTYIFITILFCALLGLFFRLRRKQKLPMLTVAMPVGIAMVLML